jgi:hypothetical protein
MKRLEDRIYETLRGEAAPVPSAELCARYLGAASSGRGAAERILDAALGRDPRFRRLPEGWEAVADTAGDRLGAVPWTVLSAAAPPAGGGQLLLLAVSRFRPGTDAPVESQTFAVGPADAVRAAAAGLEGVAAAPPQLVTELRVLRLLDEAFAGGGLVLRGLHARALAPWLRAAEDTGTVLPEPLPALAEVARLALPGRARPDLPALLDFAGVATRRDDPFADELAGLPVLLPRLLAELAVQGVERLDELEAALAALNAPLDFDRYDFTPADLADLPESPGVYLFQDAPGAVIYVGKSVNLRRRVQSYFRWRAEDDPKLERVQRETRRLRHIVLGSDLEALLEEAELIARHRPAINVQMDVQTAPREKGIDDILLALLPHHDPGQACLWALHPGGQVRRLVLPRTGTPGDALVAFLAAVESGRPHPAAQVYRDASFPLALRWLRKNSQSLTFFKYHDFPDPAALARAVGRALAEGAADGASVYR